MKFAFTILIAVFLLGDLNQMPVNQEDLCFKKIQGHWRLKQNKYVEIVFHGNRMSVYYNKVLDRTDLFKISNEIISHVFKDQIIKGGDNEYFLEQMDSSSNEIIEQFKIITLEKKCLVLSPINRGEFLTYLRVK